MKHLITVSIDAPSTSDVYHANQAFMKALVLTKDKINNGSSIRIMDSDVTHPEEFHYHIGKVSAWATGRDYPAAKPRKVRETTNKKKGWLSRIIEEVNKPI